MPLYHYQCKACKHLWEELWGSFAEADELEPLLKCPECQAPTPFRLMGAPVTKFVGDGWTPSAGKDRNYDSTAGIKEHTKMLQEEAKKVTSKDLFPDVPKPKDLG